MKNQKNLEPDNYAGSTMPMVWFGIIYGLISSLVLFILLRMRGGVRTGATAISKKIEHLDNPKIKLEVLTIEENDEEIQYDDLTRIKGIGPVISKVLNNNGVNSFTDLSKLSAEKIQEILVTNNIRLSNFESWPIQAKFAENEDWEDLETYQASI
jgi:predicted flap endonuclease-1-like 5' DNA nuclease